MLSTNAVVKLRYSPLQIPQNKIRHHLPHVPHQQGIGDAVARLWIDHQLHLLAGLLQFIEKLHCVGHVHVVIHRTVNQEQFAV